MVNSYGKWSALAAFSIMPTVISQPGDYVTRGGEKVVVTEVTTTPNVHRRQAKGYYTGGVAESWDNSGRIFPFRETKNDIVGPLLN